MCSVTAITIGATVASTAIGTYSSVQQQDAQEEAAQIRADWQEEKAHRDYAQKVEQLNVRQAQEREDTEQAKLERERQAEAEMSRLRVAAGESGLYLGSNTMAQLEQEVGFAESSDISTMESMRDRKTDQLQYQKGVAREQGTGPGMISSSPNTGLMIAGGVADAAGQSASAYSNYKQNQAYRKANT